MAVRTKDTPNGFTPISKNGGVYSGQVGKYLTTGTAVYVGDLVALTGDSGAVGAKVNGQDVEGIPYIAPATTATTSAGTPVGVCVGFEVSPTQLGQNYADASNSRIALVADDPSIEMVVQGDGDTDVLIATDCGSPVQFTTGAGSTATGRSSWELDESVAMTTASTNVALRLVRVHQVPGNSPPSQSNTTGTHTLWVVNFARHAKGLHVLPLVIT